MFETVKNRRTIRSYQDKDIPETILNELLQTATRVSTMGGMQLYSVIITRDTEEKKRLAPAHLFQPMVENAPVVLTFCADCRRAARWCECRQAQHGFDNTLFFLNAATDALLYTQQFCSLAEEIGLGICYLGTTIYKPQTIIDLLNLPQLVFPIATITLGYPKDLPQQTDRLPLEAIVHHKQYHDYSHEDINRYYAEKEALEENIHFVLQNTKQTLAQVFTDIRYPKEANEQMSQHIIDALYQQGFLHKD